MSRRSLAIPTTTTILNRAIQELYYQYFRGRETQPNEMEMLKKLLSELNPSLLAIEIEKNAERIYRHEEKQALKNYLLKRGFPENLAEDVLSMMLEEEGLLKKISNIRRARAGKTAEKIVMKILRAHDIPCEHGKNFEEYGYRPDIVVPSNEKLSQQPEKAAAIAVKRTLRERWSEDVPIFKFPNGMFVLLTHDPDFNRSKAQDMVNRGMREIYIPDSLYEESSEFILQYGSIFRKFSSLPDRLRRILNQI
jgi:hypothetical protein